MVTKMYKRWNQPGGYRRILQISLPLVASMASTTIMEFTDRIFLGHYSLEAIAAALPAGILHFVIICFFMGVINYTNVFVAQYSGADEPENVGASIWQGLYCAMLGALFLFGVSFFAEELFILGGHGPEVRKLEAIYFRILCFGAAPALVSVSLSCFFSGRGYTRPVMLVNLFAACMNIPLDYALINGKLIFPELGIAGAALATTMAWTITALFFAWLVFTPRNNQLFAVWRARKFNGEIFGRLMKFGLPGGVQFFMEMFAFTFFIFMTGRLGKLELAATNIAFSINSLAFMPMLGFHIGISTIVGQAIGRGEPLVGARAVTNSLHLTLTYMGLVVIVFLFAPEWLLKLFRPHDMGASEFESLVQTGVVLLRFVSLYTFFDALCLTFSGALKGAGDTRFVMLTMLFCSICIMVIPAYLTVEIFKAGLFAVWCVATAFISSLGIAYFLRYRSGKWQGMNVMGK
jgi:MATE family multidrug resistance protein